MVSIYFFNQGNLYVRRQYLKTYFNLENQIIEKYNEKIYKYKRLNLLLFSDLEYRLKELIVHSFGKYENELKKPLPICPIVLSKLYNYHFKKNDFKIRLLQSENRQIKDEKRQYKDLNIQNLENILESQQKSINMLNSGMESAIKVIEYFEKEVQDYKEKILKQ